MEKNHSQKKVDHDPYFLSYINFRNIVILTLGASMGISSVFLAGAATSTELSISSIVSRVNVQCNQDILCLREVATGLEKAGNTLIQVAQSLRAQISNMPTPTPTPVTPEAGSTPLPPSGISDDMGCYYRLTDAPTVADSIFSDKIKTTHIENGGVWQGLHSSTAKCEQVNLRCNNKEITAINNAGAPINLSLESKWISMTGMPSPTHPIYAPEYGTYLGESLENCQRSDEFRQSNGIIGGSGPTPTLVDNTGSTSPAGSTDSTIVSPNNPAVSGLPSWPGSGVTLICPGDDTNKGTFYSSEYQCAEARVSCNENGVITSNLGGLREILLDQTTEGIYNSLKYPQYLGRNLQECRTALQHTMALKNAGVYK